MRPWARSPTSSDKPLTPQQRQAAEDVFRDRIRLHAVGVATRVENAINVVMPMAGRGSRFGQAGFDLPKPLIPLDGQPFFWWATEALRRSFALRSLTFVVLAEHVAAHGLDRAIRERYPFAEIVALPDVTSGALATAVAGCASVPDDGWLAINDCDHTFRADSLAAALPSMPDATAGVLCHFRAHSPAYSYAAYDESGSLLRTAEKDPISDLAIAGAYGFRDRATFLRHAEVFAADCPYPELFMSGVYNTMVAAGETVRGVLLDDHLAFGTPAEYDAALGRIADFRSPDLRS